MNYYETLTSPAPIYDPITGAYNATRAIEQGAQVLDTASGGSGLFSPATVFLNLALKWGVFDGIFGWGIDYPTFAEMPPEYQAQVLFENIENAPTSNSSSVGGEDTEGFMLGDTERYWDFIEATNELGMLDQYRDAIPEEVLSAYAEANPYYDLPEPDAETGFTPEQVDSIVNKVLNGEYTYQDIADRYVLPVEMVEDFITDYQANTGLEPGTNPTPVSSTPGPSGYYEDEYVGGNGYDPVVVGVTPEWGEPVNTDTLINTEDPLDIGTWQGKYEGILKDAAGEGTISSDADPTVGSAPDPITGTVLTDSTLSKIPIFGDILGQIDNFMRDWPGVIVLDPTNGQIVVQYGGQPPNSSPYIQGPWLPRTQTGTGVTTGIPTVDMVIDKIIKAGTSDNPVTWENWPEILGTVISDATGVDRDQAILVVKSGQAVLDQDPNTTPTDVLIDNPNLVIGSVWESILFPNMQDADEDQNTITANPETGEWMYGDTTLEEQIGTAPIDIVDEEPPEVGGGDEILPGQEVTTPGYNSPGYNPYENDSSTNAPPGYDSPGYNPYEGVGEDPVAETPLQSTDDDIDIDVPLPEGQDQQRPPESEYNVTVLEPPTLSAVGGTPTEPTGPTVTTEEPPGGTPTGPTGPEVDQDSPDEPPYEPPGGTTEEPPGGTPTGPTGPEVDQDSPDEPPYEPPGGTTDPVIDDEPDDVLPPDIINIRNISNLIPPEDVTLRDDNENSVPDVEEPPVEVNVPEVPDTPTGSGTGLGALGLAQQKMRRVDADPGDLVDIKYFYDVSGGSILPPIGPSFNTQDSRKNQRDRRNTRFSQGGIVGDTSVDEEYRNLLRYLGE